MCDPFLRKYDTLQCVNCHSAKFNESQECKGDLQADSFIAIAVAAAVRKAFFVIINETTTVNTVYTLSSRKFYAILEMSRKVGLKVSGLVSVHPYKKNLSVIHL